MLELLELIPPPVLTASRFSSKTTSHAATPYFPNILILSASTTQRLYQMKIYTTPSTAPAPRVPSSTSPTSRVTTHASSTPRTLPENDSPNLDCTHPTKPPHRHRRAPSPPNPQQAQNRHTLLRSSPTTIPPLAFSSTSTTTNTAWRQPQRTTAAPLTICPSRPNSHEPR